MKVIGMYLIVAGHFFSIGNSWLYVFNVPLFFVISGFFSKSEQRNIIFWKKLFWNLFIPMFLLSAIDTCRLFLKTYLELHTLDWRIFPRQIWELIQGNHIGLGCLWFVFTLMVLKIVRQYAVKSVWINLTFSIVLPICVVFLNSLRDIGFDNPFIVKSNANAFYAAMLAYPFFGFGLFIRRYREFLSRKWSCWTYFILLLLSVGVVSYCNEVNGTIRVYCNVYGNSILLFYMGGIAGTLLIYVISRFLDKYNPLWVRDISIGSILILGLHYGFVAKYVQFMGESNLYDYIVALALILIFVPIIRFIQKFCPLLIGIYRVKK